MGAPIRLLDVDRLTRLCEEEYSRLVGLLGLYCGDALVAEEMAQETLIRLCRDWHKVSEMDNPEAWIRRVAINFAHSHYRRRAIERRISQRLGTHDRTTDSHDVEALQLLTGLPHRQRAAMILHHYLDLRLREVGEVMDLPEGTVKTLIHKALKSLRADINMEEAFDVR